jgi:hypothetical protein
MDGVVMTSEDLKIGATATSKLTQDDKNELFAHSLNSHHTKIINLTFQVEHVENRLNNAETRIKNLEKLFLGLLLAIGCSCFLMLILSFFK